MKKWLSKYFSTKEILNGWIFSGIRKYFREPTLWRFNRETIARGVAIGIFASIIPIMPFQMLMAAILAIILRANLTITLVFSWFSNPITFVPLTYFTYWVGNLFLDESSHQELLVHGYSLDFRYGYRYGYDFTTDDGVWSTLTTWLQHFGKAFFIGLPIVSIGAAIIGYIAVHLLWGIWKKIFKIKK